MDSDRAPWARFSLTATDGVCEEHDCGRVTGNNVFCVLVFGHAFCPDMQSYRKIRGATFEGRDLRDKKKLKWENSFSSLMPADLAEGHSGQKRRNVVRVHPSGGVRGLR
jgi:hypothetical protein